MANVACEELRSLFSQRMEAGNPAASSLHPADLERLKDDWWMKKFIDHNDGDLSVAVQMLADTCLWRKNFGTNDINETNLNMEYLKAGLFYPRGKDVDGCTIFVFKSKKHTKGARNFDEVMKCVVYWFERLERIEHCDRISVLFDMADTGLSNLDMDFTRYLIGLFKTYYPDFLNYILIYEMPWVLNAAFKVIKSLLPTKAVAQLKFINKSTLSQYVPLDQAHVSWGGEDDYTYSFNASNSIPDVASKKVTFADAGSPGSENPPTNFEDDNQNHTMMSLSPRDVIVFKNDGEEMIGGFTIMNTHDGIIAFKVKTTAPEKAKVVPSVGTLGVGKSEMVKISLISNSHTASVTASKIKFLIVSTPVASEAMTNQELSDIWKNMSKLKLEQHRLRCSSADFVKSSAIEYVKGKGSDSIAQVPDSDKQISMLTQSISNLKLNNESLNSQLKSLKTIQLVNVTLSALLLCLIVYFFRNVGQPSERYGEFCNGP